MKHNSIWHFNQFTNYCKFFWVSIKISEWVSTRLSNEIFTCAYVANLSICSKLIWTNNTRITLKFKGSCLKQNSKKILINSFVYELDRWSLVLNTDFTLKNCLFRAVKLTKNADPDKCKHSRYGIGFDLSSEFSKSDGSMDKNVAGFRIDMSRTLHIDNKKKIFQFLVNVQHKD